MQTEAIVQQELVKAAREQLEKRNGKSVEQLYEEREQRVTDVIQLRIPDRMPVYLRGGFFAVKYGGIPLSSIFYDSAAHTMAIIKTLVDFEPDLVYQMTAGRVSGHALDELGANQYQWPGGPLKPDEHPQFVEKEVMREDEYDLLISDPADYTLRYYLPRVWKALAPLSKLPPIYSLIGSDTVAAKSNRFSAPDVVQAFETIFRAGQKQEEFERDQAEIPTTLGIPPLAYPGGGIVAPFDSLADHLRGMKGVAIDMFKRPEKMQAAMERILEWHLTRAVPPEPKDRGRRRVHGRGSHWGTEEFLSRKQFEKFYWPTWKKSLLAAIDMGYVPLLHPEGKSDDRIECFLELPRGKALLWNEIMDVVRAKEILGGHMAFMGGVPASLLWGGSPSEVEEHCKNLIKVCGKGGGYILSCAGVEDDAKPANLKAMIDAVKKYGRY
ncbi:MAG: hypothetical protein HYX90_05070 [Chloroflexi bacterium]|nr:hypothetical protein [Chloroflexota bacterium]